MATTTVLETAASTSTAVVEDLRSPTVAILREITRGGLAGLIVGVVVGGIGGRFVMRLAALLVPAADGGLTENGNVIGDITMNGTLSLFLFAGVAVGIVGGSLWVMVAPWLPVRLGRRAVAATVLAVPIATPGLVDASNPDFIVLRHDPAVVASLIGLIALFAIGLVLTERWLDHRLPHPAARSPVTTAYALITAIGTVLTLLVVVPTLLTSRVGVSGYALVLVGLLTLASWILRVRGGDPADARLAVIARVALLVAVAAGSWASVTQVRGALLL